MTDGGEGVPSLLRSSGLIKSTRLARTATELKVREQVVRPCRCVEFVVARDVQLFALAVPLAFHDAVTVGDWEADRGQPFRRCLVFETSCHGSLSVPAPGSWVAGGENLGARSLDRVREQHRLRLGDTAVKDL